VAAWHGRYHTDLVSVAPYDHQIDLSLMRSHDRNVPAVVAHVAATQGADDGAWDAAQRWHFPQRAFFAVGLGLRVVEQRVRVGGPSRLRVIDVVPCHLKRNTASEELNPYLTTPAGAGHERNHFAVRRDRRRIVHADVIGQPMKLDAAWAYHRSGSLRLARLIGSREIVACIGDITQPAPYVLVQCSPEDSPHARRHIRAQQGPLRLALENGSDRVGRRRTAEHPYASEHFEQDAAECPHVGALVHSLRTKLLGTHVGERAKHRRAGHVGDGRDSSDAQR
jgi:hypothetical protein